jgi:hypothetical protein
MRLRRVLVGLALTGATLAVSATPALAHDCFNPTKDAHAPTAGVNYTITGFDPTTGPVFEQTGPGKGIGGFAAIAPGVFGPEQTETLYVHTLGNSNNGHELVGGPGSQKQNHACDGKGVDYLDACSTG